MDEGGFGATAGEISLLSASTKDDSFRLFVKGKAMGTGIRKPAGPPNVFKLGFDNEFLP